MLSIAANPVFGSDNCQRCQAALEVGKFLAMAAPEQGPALAVAICHAFNFNSDCDTMFGVLGIGAIVGAIAIYPSRDGGRLGRIAAEGGAIWGLWRRQRCLGI